MFQNNLLSKILVIPALPNPREKKKNPEILNRRHLWKY